MKNIDFKQILTKIKNLKFQKDAFTNIFSQKINSLIVVDIGSTLSLFNVHIKDEIRIDAFKTVELPGDKKDELILNSLRDFIKENHIEHKNAILKPSLNSLLIKRIQLPAVPEAELPEAVKWQIKEDLTFDLSSAVIGFSVIKKTTKEDGSKILDIICAVAKEQEVKDQVLLLKQAGFTCLSVGLETFGYEKIVAKYIKPEKEVALGFLHLTTDICYIAIYKNDKLEFYRELPISVNKLTDLLKGVLVSDRGRVELSTEEIKEVLLKIGIPEENSVYKEKLSSSQILSMLRPILERLAVEIRRSISYYDSEFNGGAVEKILIAGAAVNIPNIDKFLAKELSLDVKKLSLKDKLIISSTINQESLSESYAGLGLILDYQEGINLLPYEFRTEKIEMVERISLRWIVFAAFLILAVSFLFTNARIGAYQKRLDNAILHLDTLSEVKQMKIKVDELNNFIINEKNSEPPLGNILKKLSSISGFELFFSSFSLSADSKTGSITGYVKSINKNPDVILTNFIREMKNSGYFSDASIAEAKKESKQGFDVTEFNINFRLH